MQIDLYGHPSMFIELCACIARRSAWRAMKNAPPDWRGNKHCKYPRVVLSSFGQTSQQTIGPKIFHQRTENTFN